jgi:hypothetical protein
MHYLVDAENRIVEVGGGWDAAADAAGAGAGVAQAEVLGRRLESCIAGDATKMFVRAALDAARVLRQTRVLPYRCDGPGERRYFEMVISPQTDGRVKVAHRLVEARALAPRRHADQAAASSRAVKAGWRCSQCWRVRLSNAADWTEAEAAPPFGLAQDVCPECAGRLFVAAADAPPAALPDAGPGAAEPQP